MTQHVTDLVKSPTTSSEAGPAPSQSLFKFSLLTLLSVMTLAGLTSAIVFSKDWEPIERLLAAFWSAGLLVGVSFGRARGKHGIIAGGLAATFGCLIAIGVHELRFGLSSRLTESSLFGALLTFVTLLGWTLAVLAGAMYHALLTGVVERRWQQRWFRRFAWIVAAACVSALIGWQLLSAQPWRPSWTLGVSSVPSDDPLVEHAISPQGDQLLTNGVDRGYFAFGNRQTCQVRKLGARGNVSPPIDLGAVHDSPLFSPDGERIASNYRELLRVFSIAGDRLTFSEVLDHGRLEEPQYPPRFSPNGKQLRITTHTPRIQRLYTFDLTKKESRHIELFPFAGLLLISTDGRRLLKFFEPVDENGEIRLEIVDLESRQTMATIGDIPQAQTPVFSLDGKRLAIGERVWRLPDGQPRNLGGEVIGLLSGERVLVKQKAAENWLRAGLSELPFIRRLNSRQGLSRLCVLEEETGRTLHATPWSTDFDRVEMSANEKVVAACSRTGHVQIWKVPESNDP